MFFERVINSGLQKMAYKILTALYAVNLPTNNTVLLLAKTHYTNFLLVVRSGQGAQWRETQKQAEVRYVLFVCLFVCFRLILKDATDDC